MEYLDSLLNASTISTCESSVYSFISLSHVEAWLENKAYLKNPIIQWPNYYSLQQMRHCEGVEKLIKDILALKNPVDYIPLLNLVYTNKFLDVRTLNNAPNYYNKFDVFKILTQKENFIKFLIALRSLPNLNLLPLEESQNPMLYAADNENLPAVCYLMKYLGCKVKCIKRALMHRNQEVIDTIFNSKIISLEWLNHESDWQIEFYKQFDRIIYLTGCVIDANIRIIELLMHNLALVSHLAIFEMFDENDDETVKKLIKNQYDKDETFRDLIKRSTNKFKDLRNKLFAPINKYRTFADSTIPLFNRQKKFIYKFYSTIFSGDNDALDNLTAVINEAKELNYYWLRKDFLPMYIAAQKTGSQYIRALLASDVIDINVTDYQNSTISHWAMRYTVGIDTFHDQLRSDNAENFQIVYGLIYDMKPIIALQKNHLNRLPIYYAIKYDNYEAFNYLNKYYLCFVNDQLDILQKSYLMLATKRGCYEIFIYLLNFFDPYERYLHTLRQLGVTDYFSLLSIAIDRKHIRIIDHLLDLNVDVNCKTSLGITPLAIAISNCDPDTVRKLIGYDAAVNLNIANNLYFRDIENDISKKENLIKFTDFSNDKLMYQFTKEPYYNTLLTFTLNHLTKYRVGSYMYDEYMKIIREIIAQMALQKQEPIFSIRNQQNIRLSQDTINDLTYEVDIFYRKCKLELKVLNRKIIYQHESCDIAIDDFLRSDRYENGTLLLTLSDDHRNQLQKNLYASLSSCNIYCDLLAVKIIATISNLYYMVDESFHYDPEF